MLLSRNISLIKKGAGRRQTVEVAANDEEFSADFSCVCCEQKLWSLSDADETSADSFPGHTYVCNPETVIDGD